MKLGRYKHFKGEIVEVIFIAFHTETKEKFVIYKHNNTIWARPFNMFNEIIDKPEYNYKGQRFFYIGD